MVNDTANISRHTLHQTILTHFPRVPSKLNYSNKLFQSSYHTILTFSKSNYQTISSYSELLPNSCKHFFEGFNRHLKSQTENFQDKARKISMRTWNKILSSTILKLIWLTVDGFMEENDTTKKICPHKKNNSLW